MKKILSLVLSLTLLFALTIPAYAETYSNTDPSTEELISMALAGVDQRSSWAKANTNVTANAIDLAEKSAGTRSAPNSEFEVYTVTLLENRTENSEEVTETYSSYAIAVPMSTSPGSDSNVASSQAGAAYAKVNYTIKVENGDTSIRLNSSQHKVVNAQNTALSLRNTNDIYRNYNVGENERISTVNSPSNNTWYSLSPMTSSYYSIVAVVVGASTTAYFNNGASPVYVECMVQN